MPLFVFTLVTTYNLNSVVEMYGWNDWICNDVWQIAGGLAFILSYYSLHKFWYQIYDKTSKYIIVHHTAHGWVHPRGPVDHTD